MSHDARQQKRKEKRNKREKEKRKQLNRDKSVLPFAQIAKVNGAPFLYCCINEVAFNQGIGNLLVSRTLPSGLVVSVIFLVDLYCLGIKNIVCRVCSRFEVDRLASGHLYKSEPGFDLTPEEAKKLVVEAAAYAARYGFRPHEDYLKCLAIFAGVDASGCTKEFTFGKDGKPFYISGPHDKLQFRNRVRDTLERTAGPGNYDFLIMLDRGDLGNWRDDNDDDEATDDDLPRPLDGANSW